MSRYFHGLSTGDRTMLFMRGALYIAVMYTLFYLLFYMMYYHIIYYINNPTCITLYSLDLMKMKPRRHKGCYLYVIMLMVVKNHSGVIILSNSYSIYCYERLRALKMPITPDVIWGMRERLA